MESGIGVNRFFAGGRHGATGSPAGALACASPQQKQRFLSDADIETPSASQSVFMSPAT